MIRRFIIPLLILCLSVSLSAQQPGVMIVEKTTSPPIFGLSGTTDTTRTYLTKYCIRRDEGQKGQSTIIRSDIKKIWLLQHADLTYSEMTTEMFQGLGMMGLMMFGVTIDTLTGLPIIPNPLFRKTGRTRKMGKWNCFELVLNKKSGEGFINEMLGSMSLWVSPDTGLDNKTYATIMRRMMGSLGQEYEPFFRQLEEVGGYPVLVKSKIMGRDVKQRLLTFKKKEMAASLFELPSGYKKEEKLFDD